MLAAHTMVYELLWAVQEARGVTFAAHIADHSACISVTIHPCNHPRGNIFYQEFTSCLAHLIFLGYTILPCVQLPLLVLRGEQTIVSSVCVCMLSSTTTLGRCGPDQFIHNLLSYSASQNIIVLSHLIEA